MKILYGARNVRPDLLKAVTYLACFFTKWTSQCDRRLHRLVCYIHSTCNYRLLGWIGDAPSKLQPHLFADADFAGCVETQRSTSGLHLALRGPNSCFPIAGVSKRQTCVSHSTPEAEMVSMDHALRHCGLPCLDLWHALLPHQPGLVVHEDNQAMIKIVETGRNPTMRYIGRTHGVSVAWLHETFKGDDLALAYEITTRMCADIYTKAFTDADKWRLACWLINICDPKELPELARRSIERDEPLPQSGGSTSSDTNPVTKTGGPTKTPAAASSSGDLGRTRSPSPANKTGGTLTNVVGVSPTGSASRTSGEIAGGNGDGVITAATDGTAGSTTGHTDVTLASESDGGGPQPQPQQQQQQPQQPQQKESTPLRELRLGRCLTYKASQDKTILNVLRKTFKKTKNNDDAANPCQGGHPLAQNELSGLDAQQTWCTSTSYRLQPQEERLVRAVNKLVREKVQGYDFTWGTIRVTAGGHQREHLDITNSGPSLAMLFGDFAGGAFASGLIRCSDTQKIFTYNGRSPFQSEAATGERFLVEVFTTAGAENWHREYKQYLASLGFNLGAAVGDGTASGTVTNAGGLDAGSASGTGVQDDPKLPDATECYKAFISQDHDRVLVEGCCEPGSLLQAKTKFSRGCKVVPITKDDDFASVAGMQKCMQSLRGPSDTLWFSAPCTGGSTWQFINLKRGPATVAKIQLHWKLFKRLWAAFEVVAAHALHVGARVFVEWPRRCAYWKNDRVSKFMVKHRFVYADFDGCMFGLTAASGSVAGMPIQKPWRVACSPDSCLPAMLNRRCDGSHEHARCEGRNTLLTQGYTPEIAKIVHKAIVADIAAVNKKTARRTADGAVEPDSVVSYADRAIVSVGIEEMNEGEAIAALTALSP